MLKVTSELDGIKMNYTIESEKSCRMEFVGAIELLLQNLYKNDRKIKNDRDFMKFLKEFRKMSSDFIKEK